MIFVKVHAPSHTIRRLSEALLSYYSFPSLLLFDSLPTISPSDSVNSFV